MENAECCRTCGNWSTYCGGESGECTYRFRGTMHDDPACEFYVPAENPPPPPEDEDE